jgi:hypothetical protein
MVAGFARIAEKERFFGCGGQIVLMIQLPLRFVEPPKPAFRQEFWTLVGVRRDKPA